MEHVRDKYIRILLLWVATLVISICISVKVNGAPHKTGIVFTSVKLKMAVPFSPDTVTWPNPNPWQTPDNAYIGNEAFAIYNNYYGGGSSVPDTVIWPSPNYNQFSPDNMYLSLIWYNVYLQSWKAAHKGSSFPIADSAWALRGNSGTNITTNFIGTIDDVPLLFKVANDIAGYLGNNANGNAFYGKRCGNTTFTSAIQNSLFGSFSWQNIVDASNNSGVGNNNGDYIIHGVGNGLFGWGNMGGDGSYNELLAYDGMAANVSGSYNFGGGYHVLITLLTGNYNIGLGTFAGYGLTTGSYCMALGYGTNFKRGDLTNCTIIGANTWGAISNMIGLGDSSVGTKTGICTQVPGETLDVNGTTHFKNSGQATLTNGIDTVFTSAITSNSLVFLTQTVLNSSTTIGVKCVRVVSAGSYFIVQSLTSAGITSTGDQSTFNWWITERQ